MIKLTAAPVVYQPMVEIGAPGKTDFVRLYIASELNKSEHRTTLRHEQAHVWAAHNRRVPKDAVRELWRIACEMEIARTIYDDQDVITIKAPRSRLAGGYLPDSITGLPDDAELAEDIYEWLLSHQDKQELPSVSCCSCACGDDETGSCEPLSAEAASLVQAARDLLDSDEKRHASQLAVAESYTGFINRPPTLTEAVDAALRVRMERERSYRRPSRRHDGSDVLLAGAVSVPRPPLVEIFVDRSGSFTPEKTAAAEQQLNLLLSRYGATIRSDVWFFGAGKLVSYDPGGGGNTPYELILKHLALSAPKLAIVLTDDDPVSLDVKAPSVKTIVLCVPIGCQHTALAVAVGGTDVVTR